MAQFAAKYLVKSATSGVRGTMGDVDKQFGNEEQVAKEEMERIEREVEKEEEVRRKRYMETEAKRSKIRDQIRNKYGIKKSERHDAAIKQRTSHTSEKDFLLEEEEEEDEGCCPSLCMCSCWPCFSNSSKSKHSKIT